MDESYVHVLIKDAEDTLQPYFKKIEENALKRQKEVLLAFRQQQVEARHFSGTNGYGYDDIGRDKLEYLLADIMKAESALVRPGIASGTHALCLALFGVLRPGDTILSVSGAPYDTLASIIGLNGKEGMGSLREWGVGYSQLELLEDNGLPDIDAILYKLQQDTSIRMVYLQRSRGYSLRSAISTEDMRELFSTIRKSAPGVIIMVDNCYGEFVEAEEPIAVGADLMAGSFIKNPGGGIAPSGGYICGKKVLIEQVASRLTAPGIGAEVGSYEAGYRAFYQGLFLAPHMVSQAIKGAVLAAKLYADLGYDVSPAWDAHRGDIIQAIALNNRDRLIRFCKAIQSASPIDSHLTPEPWAMPGYRDEVIMAAGTFVQGATLELSVDAPVKPPYVLYMQGGLTYEHCKLAITETLLNETF
ncbi:MAG: aminotransferase class I/II-fold pyridoxal phosphate-dependent enzyme [Christensenellales bacterium]|jgi:cystathionine beta-lyase family protein involved in aluminum resistance